MLSQLNLMTVVVNQKYVQLLFAANNALDVSELKEALFQLGKLVGQIEDQQAAAAKAQADEQSKADLQEEAKQEAPQLELVKDVEPTV